MKKKRILAVFTSLVLCLATASPAFAQTITIDEGKDGVYSGDILMTQNMRTDFDYFQGDRDFNDHWEVTGIPKARGVSGVAETTDDTAEAAIASPVGNALDEKQEMTNAKADSVSNNYKIGDEKQIVSTSGSLNDATTQTFTAKCVAVTENCTVWIDTKNKEHGGLISEEAVAGYAQQIQGFYTRLTEDFGDSKRLDVDGDGKVAFIFYPFKSFTTGGYYGPSDLEINKMDMLNINSRASEDNGKTLGEGLMLAILSHEWQHLINDAQTGNSSIGIETLEDQYNMRGATWLNESFSQSAVYLCGVSGRIPAVQIDKYSRYIEENNKSITVPFAFSGPFVPGEDTGNLHGGVYANWYLFGRYLSSQTRDYAGGGDAIYKTVLNAIRDKDVVDPDSGKVFHDLGMCNNKSLAAALTQIGYMGAGPDAKVKDFEELLTNYNMATFFRQSSGLYSLGTQEEIGNVDIDSVGRPEIKTAEESPQQLPGGATATFTKIENGSIAVDEKNQGEHIRHLGITIHYDGVTADGYNPVDGAMTVDKGTAVSLGTGDTNVTLRYTTDGTDPTAETGTVYEGPVTIDRDMTIKAITADEYGTSDVAVFNYKVKTEAPAGTGEGTTTDKNAEGTTPGGSGKNAGTGITDTQAPTLLTATALLLLAAGGCILIRKRVKK